MLLRVETTKHPKSGADFTYEVHACNDCGRELRLPPKEQNADDEVYCVSCGSARFLKRR